MNSIVVMFFMPQLDNHLVFVVGNLAIAPVGFLTTSSCLLGLEWQVIAEGLGANFVRMPHRCDAVCFLSV